MIAFLEVGHALADALYNAGALVAQDHWKQTLRIGAAQGEGISMANTSCCYLDSDLRHFFRKFLFIKFSKAQ